MAIDIGAYQNRQRRTCIVVGQSKDSAEIVALDTTTGLRVSSMTEAEFNKEYEALRGYPLRKAIEQYIEFGTYCGMSEQVKGIFESMLKDAASKEEVDVTLALSKLRLAKVIEHGNTTKSKAAKATKSKATNDDPPWEEETGEKLMKKPTKVPELKTQKNSDSIKIPRQSAAQMFRELILSNSYDDDQIFKMVQKEYGLDDSKRNYVAYYRRELKQKGLI